MGSVKKVDFGNHRKNILASLEFLAQEAKRGKDEKLYKILMCCLKSANGERGDLEFLDVIAANDDDYASMLMLLDRFVNASDEAREEFLAFFDDVTSVKH